MVVSEPQGSYREHYGRNPNVATDTTCSQNDPHHIDVHKDGTFVGPEDDKDATGNPGVIVPYDVRPDPIVSQCAVVPHAKHTIVTRQTDLKKTQLTQLFKFMRPHKYTIEKTEP